LLKSRSSVRGSCHGMHTKHKQFVTLTFDVWL